MNKKLFILPFLLLSFLTGCGGKNNSSEELKPQANISGINLDKYVQIIGRYWFDEIDECYCYYNGGTSIDISFTGTKLDMDLQTLNFDPNYYGSEISVLIDNEKDAEKAIMSVSRYDKRHVVTIADGLENKEHVIRIIKRHDSKADRINVFGFSTDGLINFYKKDYKYNIEFYGDSITAGAGAFRKVVDGVATGGFDKNTCSYTGTYAYYATEELGGCSSFFGRGSIALHYKSPNQTYTIDENYDKVAVDFPVQDYDYRFKPNVVVIYLGTNDYNASIGYQLGYTSAGMKQAVIDFIRTAIYGKYGEVPVILPYGYMVPDSDLGDVMNAVKADLNGQGHTIETIHFDATPNNHPLYTEHKIGGHALAELIRSLNI